MISSILTSLHDGRSAAEPRRARAYRGHSFRALTAIAIAAALLVVPTLGGSQALAAGTTEIREFVLAKNIVDREPVGISDSFSTSDQQVFAFVRVDNPGMPTNVSFVWHRDDQVHATVKNSVGTSSSWRTWSSARLSPGKWRVLVVLEDGRVAGEKSFSIGRMNAPAISQMPQDKGMKKSTDKTTAPADGMHDN